MGEMVARRGWKRRLGFCRVRLRRSPFRQEEMLPLLLKWRRKHMILLLLSMPRPNPMISKKTMLIEEKIMAWRWRTVTTKCRIMWRGAPRSKKMMELPHLSSRMMSLKCPCLLVCRILNYALDTAFLLLIKENFEFLTLSGVK
ncbi:Os05g0463500 [Oryza sativa Japonica Group]|uniref:Os05g0463500 protein n=1 Tax=Oryza sativa subsp. japonica TaxID=39947 RepID=Q60EQ6_ORYSJ|nr:unknown protein [Oryza sativa Japonica Group]BAF17686.1 Os05g0463500 [Oryza sativa Japonica Group]|eukprot:NP_001055772.1 Os05g0463500 [Oryza sativa Japonica Group]